jgi:O-antigen/teichoic acid export membrane protein
MLVSQAFIYFAANVVSAAFGLLNVVVLTRLFSPGEYGIYVLGMAFAIVMNTCLTGWLRLPILREQARGDGTDVRGLVMAGLALSVLALPVAFPVALACGLGTMAGVAAIALALAMGTFEIGLDVLRAQMRALTHSGATIARAALVSACGILTGLIAGRGVLLLGSAALDYGAAIAAFGRPTWRGAWPSFDRGRLAALFKGGVPVTLSMVLLAASGVIDRFIVAHLAGAAEAGRYGASVDLAYQALLMPAISLASAFVPSAVQTLALKGKEATALYLQDGLEFLFAVTLPCCLGFAIVAHHVAALVLGAEFRGIAAEVMPVVAISVVFQVLTQQYVHISFLLSNRNSFYLWNTGSVIAFNVVLAYVLIGHWGVVGAAWSRLGATAFGLAGALVLTRWAFPVPLPFARLSRALAAGLVMAAVVGSLDWMIDLGAAASLGVLVPAGVVSYALACWVQDVARLRTGVLAAVRFASRHRAP